MSSSFTAWFICIFVIFPCSLGNNVEEVKWASLSLLYSPFILVFSSCYFAQYHLSSCRGWLVEGLINIFLQNIASSIFRWSCKTTLIIRENDKKTPNQTKCRMTSQRTEISTYKRSGGKKKRRQVEEGGTKPNRLTDLKEQRK